MDQVEEREGGDSSNVALRGGVEAAAHELDVLGDLLVARAVAKRYLMKAVGMNDAKAFVDWGGDWASKAGVVQVDDQTKLTERRLDK